MSSGLSIAEMAQGRAARASARNFLGIHLFNPPNVIVGTEVIPHAETDPALVPEIVAHAARRRFGRVVDRLPRHARLRRQPRRLQGAERGARSSPSEHGVAFIDYLIGPYTGRAMPPLATIDLVGWDVHQAIVDNVHANTNDEAHAAFALPDLHGAS